MGFVETLTSSTLFYLFLIVGIFSVGDILGVVTKAKISSVFVALICFLVGFLTGVLPADIVQRAGLDAFAKLAGPLIIVHMGTMIDLKQLMAEWRTVVTAMLSMAVAAVAIFAISPFIGRENAVVAIPIINGGLIATQIMSEAAMEKGFAIAAALGAILYATQKFAGSYPASFFGMKEAREIVAEYRLKKEKIASGEIKEEKVAEAAPTFASKNNKYFTDFVCIGIAVMVAWVANALGAVTPINYSIWGLLGGATLGHLGIVPKRILERGKASGLLSMLVFATIMPSLAKITLADLTQLGILTIAVLGVTLVALFLAFNVLPGWKIIKSKNLAMGVAMGQLLGFPATFLIANEVAKAASDDPAEQEAVLEKIMPTYVVAGITTVTVLSVVVAGIFSKMV